MPSFQQQKLNSIFNKTTTTTTNTTNTLTSTTNNTTNTTVIANDNNKNDCKYIFINVFFFVLFEIFNFLLCFKVNTISEVPEETLSNEITISNSIVQPQQQVPPPLPPMPASLSYRSTTSSASSPPPPPLPPLPSTQQTFVNNHQTDNNFINTMTTPTITQPSQQMPQTYVWPQTTQQTFNTPLALNHHQLTQSSIFATPQSPISTNTTPYAAAGPIVYTTPYPNQMYTPTMPQPMYYQPTYLTHNNNNSNINNPSTPITTNNNETFEAKWARLQATKKPTNPFAEDLLKKYEIKL